MKHDLKANFVAAFAESGPPSSVTVHPNEEDDMREILKDEQYWKNGKPPVVICSYNQHFGCPMLEYFTPQKDGSYRWDMKMTFDLKNYG